jgi:hypothetical protein
MPGLEVHGYGPHNKLHPRDRMKPMTRIHVVGRLLYLHDVKIWGKVTWISHYNITRAIYHELAITLFSTY